MITGGPDLGLGWHSGLQQAAEDPHSQFDLLLVLSDGNPELLASDAGNADDAVSERPANSDMEALNRAISAANTLKTQGTRIVAVSIGAGGGSPHVAGSTGSNLAAISGPVAGADYRLSSDHAALYHLLGGLATGACETPTAGTMPDRGADSETDSGTISSDGADADEADPNDDSIERPTHAEPAGKSATSPDRTTSAEPDRIADLTLINAVRNGSAGTASAAGLDLPCRVEKSGEQDGHGARLCGGHRRRTRGRRALLPGSERRPGRLHAAFAAM